MPSLDRYHVGDVTLLSDTAGEGVAFAFTERTGGVSATPYASLNLGSRCGDDPACVAENRRRALAALGAADLAARLVCPHQVHGDRVVVVRSGAPDEVSRAQKGAETGADAVVCVAEDVPALLCFADCVPVVLVAPHGFAVVHSGWRGTLARISATAARTLANEAGCATSELLAYVGPHVGACDYEVSDELAARFVAEFGGVVCQGRHLDLSRAVRAALAEAGVGAQAVAEVTASTASSTGRFFSYRSEDGACGRHGALALMRSRPWTWPTGARVEEGERFQ
ncbi:laccase domain-containing protein [Thermophilibacter immobilis]|jgi:YfiH family protein|uniref:Laccase domain-containing protein n=1 Tax=Thermophilibacter immobilis TaxID=2779519 RepID=A0A7S7RUA8_9ACTN|nr:laccase domain-containing protein [Thermophilibacter immobilis]